MLRALVLALLAANLAYAAWSQGWLEGYGLLPSPTPTREPHRLALQVQPQRMQLLNARAPAMPATSPPLQTTPEAAPVEPTSTPATPAAVPEPAGRCLQVAALNERQLDVLRIALLSGLPDSGWVTRTTTQPARWIVYSGKLGSAAVVAAKKAELRELRVEFRDVNIPALQPGLAMGTYSTEAAAQQALKDVTRAGVKGAKVVSERPETTLTTVQWPQATDTLRDQVQALLQRLAGEGLEGKQPQPCP